MLTTLATLTDTLTGLMCCYTAAVWSLVGVARVLWWVVIKGRIGGGE